MRRTTRDILTVKTLAAGPRGRSYIAKLTHPRLFIFTTTRDDRVHPGHARKMAALMMSQGHDVVYFENVEGGHGSGVTPEQRAESLALTLSYLHLQLGKAGRPISQ